MTPLKGLVALPAQKRAEDVAVLDVGKQGVRGTARRSVFAPISSAFPARLDQLRLDVAARVGVGANTGKMSRG
jgi:hypothetical protein